tara:strand:- start:468 stop:974 length:507 start_codon:yes stop_codon:yes gene_type:complete
MKNLVSSILGYAAITTFVLAPFTVHSQDLSKNSQSLNYQEMECLALNIYYEARSSNFADKAAVADVVINRTLDRRYPETICGVVHDGYKAGKKNCQFSWYCDGKDDNPQNLDAWYEAQSIAYNMLQHNTFRGITEGATHYHATYVEPHWADSLQMVGTIGKHIYYRWE